MIKNVLLTAFILIFLITFAAGCFVWIKSVLHDLWGGYGGKEEEQRMPDMQKFAKVIIILITALWLISCVLALYGSSCRGIAVDRYGNFAVLMNRDVYFYNNNGEQISWAEVDYKGPDIYYDSDMIYIDGRDHGSCFYDFNGNRLDGSSDNTDIYEHLSNMKKGGTSVNAGDLSIRYDPVIESISVEKNNAAKEIQYEQYIVNKMVYVLQAPFFIVCCIFILIYNKIAKKKIVFKLWG